MIVTDARRVLMDAKSRRSSKECDIIAETVVIRSQDAMGLRFSRVEKIVDNRNSACFRLYDADRSYLLKVNKHRDSLLVHDSALRMGFLYNAITQGAFSVPKLHYVDKEFDAAVIDFIQGTRFDIALTQTSDPSLIKDYLKKAAAALSLIHNIPLEAAHTGGGMEISDLRHEIISIFPEFLKRNEWYFNELVSLKPIKLVTAHGDYSPKNLILDDTGTLFVIDFADVSDSLSPLRDISIFSIGLARALTVSMKRLWVISPIRDVEGLVQEFIFEYLNHSPLIAKDQEILSKQLALFELVRLAETKIWIDGYQDFDEALLGWLKSKLGRRFIASQLERLQNRIG
jgi:hypothetical protein